MTALNSSLNVPPEGRRVELGEQYEVGLPYPEGAKIRFLPTESGRPRFKREGTIIELSASGRVLTLNPGLHLAVARTGIGKTSLLKQLCALEPDTFQYINLLEPFNDETERVQQIVTYDLEEAIKTCDILVAGGVVPVLDSLRVLVYTSTGATGKRGVNMSMFIYLSALSNALARAGGAMIAAINPLIDEADDYEFFLDNCRSAVAGVMEVKTKSSLEYTGRPDRKKTQNFSFKFSPNAAEAALPGLAINANASDRPSDLARAMRPRLSELASPSVGKMIKGIVSTLN